MAKQKIISFPKSAAEFLAKLKRNNNKEWFNNHREEFETHYFVPAQIFVSELGEKLKAICPQINAIPKTDKSIFRIHRDVRFSKDKSPYKTNMGILFWEGSGKKMESPGFYIHIEPKLYFVASGMYMFTVDQIKKFREIVSNPKKAEELKSIIFRLEKKGYKTSGKTFKQTPRGFDKTYEHADLYLYSGLYAGYESKNMNEVFKNDFVDLSFKICNDHLPLHQWLIKNIA